MRLLLLILFAFASTILLSQSLSIDWHKEIYMGREAKVVVDSDSNSYVAFSELDTAMVYQCPADTFRWIYLTKSDQWGNCLWSKSYLDMGADNTIKGLAI